MNLVDKINKAFTNSKKNSNKITDIENNIAAIKNDATFDYAAYDLPILYLTGNTTGISKDNTVDLEYVYGDLSGSCTLKWQGSSSLSYPKKNYTIKFDNEFEAYEGWGAQKKYCLKANYIDFSHARNVVSAKLWGEIVKSRTTKNENLYELPNGGAIDGFPIMVVINDKYQGLYSFNIPKDKWMFGMSDDVTTNCIVCANTHSTATKFKGNALVDETDFEFEYLPDENNYQWAIDSLNTMIDTCINSTGSSFEDNVGKYMDMDSAIDYYIFACLLTGVDITDKNYLLATYDGVKWFFTAYDLDTTFGNHWNGKSYYKLDEHPFFDSYNNENRLMHLIYTYKPSKLKSRYNELRNNVLSEENVFDLFSNYLADIPKALLDEEVKIWNKLPGTNTNNLSQIMNNYRLRCKMLDDEINNL